MEYNTSRPQLAIPEYGRNVLKMVEFAREIEDKEERTKTAHAIIQVMAQLNPKMQDIPENQTKLWNHLYAIAGYDLDVDSPFPMPELTAEEPKPNKPRYKSGGIRYKHYGKSIEDMIKKACDFEEGEEKEFLVGTIANMMKRAYLNWNRDSVNDETIINQLDKLSEGKLSIPEGFEFLPASELVTKQKPQHKDNKKKSNKYKKSRRK